MNRLLPLLLLLISLPAAGSRVVVECAQVVTDASKTRLVFATTAPVSHRIFALDHPDRVVIDLPTATLIGKLPDATAKDPTLVGLRSGLHNQDDLRIVLDLKQAVRVKSFTTGPGNGEGHRLIIDLIPRTTSVASGDSPRTMTQTLPRPDAPRGKARPILVAIDAGHGGEDPGAIGPGGTREKDVTLAIARKLAALVNREPGMQALMIRDGDYFIGLRQRMLMAREQNADLFISIHADAYNNADAHGSSVYTLSSGGASSEAAMWLANRENNADRVGGIDLPTNDDLLATVLMDMTQNATIEHSTEAANAVLAYLGHLGNMHKNEVQRASFMVLKSPDIPSVLVETAFISNQDEERRLTSNAHQQRLAQAILAGVRTYFKKYPLQGFRSASSRADTDARFAPPAPATSTPLGTEPAPAAPPSRSTALRPVNRSTVSREHVINSGDTLSGIASRYRVSLTALRAQNGLHENDMIRAGQVLTIPSDS